MATATRSTLRDQLPKRAPWTFERILNAIGAVTSIVALLLVFTSIDSLSSDNKIIVAMTYLFLIIVFLIIYILVNAQRRLQRYAQAVFHIHFVNHAIRDHLAAVGSGRDTPPLKDILGEILGAIAACYSILTGRLCRVSIKEIKAGPPTTVTTAQRDNISAASVDSPSIIHELDKNTDFRNLWYCQNGCSRYYFSNNLIDDWKNHKYENELRVCAARSRRRSSVGRTRGVAEQAEAMEISAGTLGV